MAPDPRFVNIEIAKMKRSKTSPIVYYGEFGAPLEQARVSKKDHPQWFGTVLDAYLDQAGETHFITVKDFSSIEITDSLYNSHSFETLVIRVKRCVEATSPVPCASASELEEYMKNTKFELAHLYNYVDHAEIDPGVGPVKQTLKVAHIYHASSL